MKSVDFATKVVPENYKWSAMDRKKAILKAVDILAAVVRNIHLRRALSDVCAQPELIFWRIIYGNCTDTAVLEWCKLFGNDDKDKQPVHWKSLSSDHDQFRKEMFSELNISKDKWQDCWEEMKRYRNRAVAHFDPLQVEILNYPKFDLALKSAEFYYLYLRGELATLGEGLLPENLADYGDAFAKQSNAIAEVALHATKSFRQVGPEMTGIEKYVAWAFRLSRDGGNDIVWCSYFSDFATAKQEFEKAANLTSDEKVTRGEGLTIDRVKAVNIGLGQTKIVFDGK